MSDLDFLRIPLADLFWRNGYEPGVSRLHNTNLPGLFRAHPGMPDLGFSPSAMKDYL
ncbi:hypothetical protein MXF29_11880 [Pseudomonas sp. NC26]|mgnify:CR=1 FL=1|uniref:Uncharacterized protein n=1 Tax=Pseudomonas putida TaxID=303 RepID=A0A7W2L0W2_PSEPU|nr:MULTISPECIES: hypothetical protein [Pseudomonas]MBA6116432.1 hypothetical protein [Pseudomonas putida]MCZ9636797.1 hypothetical protein [Pseudomonas putida]MEC4876293.1 hypothetical protein [Pseudomonas sp. NC26]QNL88968.1 Uncharacterized protein PPKH_3554 [Pseudomonas putida]